MERSGGERFKSVVVERTGEALGTMTADIDWNLVRPEMFEEPHESRSGLHPRSSPAALDLSLRKPATPPARPESPGRSSPSSAAERAAERVAAVAWNSYKVIMQTTLLAFLDDIYEDLELWYPKLRLEEAGYLTRLAAPALRTFTGKHGYPAQADLVISDAQSADYGGLLIPGGFMPDKLRRDPKVLALTREFFAAGKLVAFICHGGWIPISAGILRGKRATGSLGIKDDLENAGAIWLDEPVVLDGNLISSRTPRDLAPFAKAMVQFFEQRSTVSLG
jgi:protease I